MYYIFKHYKNKPKEVFCYGHHDILCKYKQMPVLLSLESNLSNVIALVLFQDYTDFFVSRK